MKKIVSCFCVGLMLTMLSCNSGPSSADPKATLTSFFQAMAKKDFEGAKKYATKESEQVLNLVGMAIEAAGKMNQKEADEQMKKFGEVVFGDAKIDGDLATVPVTEKTSGETAEIALKKEDGAWKVAFDTNTLAEMEGKKARQEGKDLNVDSLKRAIQNINPDSLKAQMEQGMKMMDSISRAMKQ